MPLDPIIQALKNRIEQLEDENAELRERLSVKPDKDYTYGAFFKLTPSEEILFQCLMDKDFCRHLYLFNALYSGKPDKDRDDNVVPVFICKLQAKLKIHEIYIAKRWGQGYYLTTEAKEQIIKLVNPLRRLMYAKLPDSPTSGNS